MVVFSYVLLIESAIFISIMSKDVIYMKKIDFFVEKKKNFYQNMPYWIYIISALLINALI